MKKNLFFLTLFIIIVMGLYRGLSLNPHHHTSPLVNKIAPAFQLNTLGYQGTTMTAEIFKDKVTILQFWASWCSICHENHQFWVEKLSKKDNSLQNSIQWVGVNYHDSLEDAQKFLKENKNPYQLNLVDEKGRMGIDYGILGIPEMFVIDAKGIIRYHHQGPMTFEVWQAVIRQEVGRCLKMPVSNAEFRRLIWL